MQHLRPAENGAEFTFVRAPRGGPRGGGGVAAAVHAGAPNLVTPDADSGRQFIVHANGRHLLLERHPLFRTLRHTLARREERWLSHKVLVVQPEPSSPRGAASGPALPPPGPSGPGCAVRSLGWLLDDAAKREAQERAAGAAARGRKVN